MERNNIRKTSINYLQKFGINIPNTLPFIEENYLLRSQEEVVSRLLCLHAAAACAYGFNTSKAVKWLKQEEVYEATTREEQMLLGGDNNLVDVFKIRVEANWVLAWSLSLVDNFEFSSESSDDFVDLLPNLNVMESSNNIVSICKLRPYEQIYQLCDVAYCLHWALVDSILKKGLFNFPSKNDVIVERRRAFEWLLSTDDWDEISFDT